MSTYNIKSVKIKEQFEGELEAAIVRAMEINDEYQPSFGVQVESEEGETLWDSEEDSNDDDNQYRFENGSLYRFDADSNAYIHCFSSPYAETEEDAIRMYEESQERHAN